MQPVHIGENVTLYHADCLAAMREMAENSIDTIITDPPYGLSFMGKEWDHGVPGIPFWEAALRVAKPGAMLLAFGGTRTHHRLMCAIEDAGWEIRDCLMWLYGSGFPKSHDIGKAIDKAAGAEREVVGQSNRHGGGINHIYGEGMGDGTKTVITAPATEAAREWDGWGTALKPAWEPIIVAMKPLDGTFARNALGWGVAGINVDGGRIGTNGDDGRWPANVILDEEAAAMLDEQSGTSGGGKYSGVVQRPRMKSWHGKDSRKIVNSVDGLANAPDNYGDVGGASRFFYTAKASRSERNAGLDGMPEREIDRYGECKQGATPQQTPRRTRIETNFHPTVKPVELLRYLCRLTATPTGGIVLDPFMGSGSTGIACAKEGRGFVGIEIDEEYSTIAEKRIAHALQQPRFVLPPQEEKPAEAGPPKQMSLW